ncbi:MAG: c-type cytochrome, partial [Kofleriaceae bacterium]
GAMPNLGVLVDDAQRLAAFIAATPLAAPAEPAPVARPPRLARRVTWGEVESKVFRKVCWHCHAVADYALGDGGPGNTGGFGFAPRGLDLSSYAGISAGSVDDAGEPRSIFALLPDGTPRLVAHLLARHAEQAGQVVDGIRGMPLGLPALPLEHIQLVDTWIAQGRPQ